MDAYLAAHPGVKPCTTPSSGTSSTATSSGCSDLRLRALTDTDRAAAARLVDATGNLNQASINLQSLPAAGNAFRVVDAPRIPTGPVAGMKKAVVGVFAGIFAGLLASALGVAGITSLQRAVRPVGDPAEAEEDAEEPAPASRRPIEIEVFGDDDAAEPAAPPPSPPAPAPAADASSLRVGARVEQPAPERREPHRAPVVSGGDGRSATDDMVWDAAPPPPAAAARLAPVPAGTNGAARTNGGAGAAKPAEPKVAEPEAVEPNAAEPKAAGPKAAGPKAAEPKAAEPKAAEPKAAEPKAAEPKAAEPKAAESEVIVSAPTAAEAATPASKPAPAPKGAGARGRRGTFSGTVVRVRVDGTGPEGARGLERPSRRRRRHAAEPGQSHPRRIAARLRGPRAHAARRPRRRPDLRGGDHRGPARARDAGGSGDPRDRPALARHRGGVRARLGDERARAVAAPQPGVAVSRATRGATGSA